MKVGAIVLAAGGSTRLGQPKQLLRYEGQTLVRRAAETALRAGCDPVLVVIGRDHREINGELENLAVILVPNESWKGGLGTSLRAAMAALPAVDAVIILACDQPHVNGELLRQIIDQHHATGKPMVASDYAGTVGVPALFAASCFDQLRSLGDDGGAKGLLRAQPNDVATVPFAEGAIDLDTPEDYQSLINGRRRNP